MKFQAVLAVVGLVIVSCALSACDAESRASILANEKCMRKPDPAVASACAYGVRMAELEGKQIHISPQDRDINVRSQAEALCAAQYGSRSEINGCADGVEAYVTELKDLTN